MTSINHFNLSLIIPCYNEYQNIPYLFNQLSEIQKNYPIEVILINNGSTDESNKLIEKNKFRLENLKIINIEKNIGFGNGVKQGILNSSNDLICYTHGDLQVNLKYIIEALSHANKQQNTNIFIKGLRKKRNIVDIFFTKLMSIYNSILFYEYLVDIHSQPNMFFKPDKKVINAAPNDMLIDLYFYAYFKKKNFKIHRFDIYFEKRKFGVGSNEKLTKKIKYSIYSLKKSIEILNNIKKIF
jgi:polyisoprenyl-phosphate glycosyltransferase